MRTTLPAYIVAEIPDPVRAAVQLLRDELCPETARLPVEITLTGSSGVGPVCENTDLSLIADGLESALSGIRPFEVSFSGFRTFPQTSIIYLSPADRAPFDRLHAALRRTGIPFANCRFPYTPHCTVRHGAPLPAEESRRICRRPFPADTFIVNTISVYGLNSGTLECQFLSGRQLDLCPRASPTD